MNKEEFDVLFARIDDLYGRAERGELGVTAFLSPREQHFVKKYLAFTGRESRLFFFGGFDVAERKRAFILPDYIFEPENFDGILMYLDASPISCVEVIGSGYRKLSHRDYLGSLLGLGLQRDVIGDIAVNTEEGKESALVFCDSVIAKFLVSELKKVANDSVKVKEVSVDRDFKPTLNFSHISDTVASARADCIVASLCKLSREKALAEFSLGNVEIDYEKEERPDRTVSAPSVISVKGYGKFKLNSVSDVTKKGRLRLDADKYI